MVAEFASTDRVRTMFRRWLLLLALPACSGPMMTADAGAVEPYCGTVRWDRNVVNAEVGPFMDSPRAGSGCLRLARTETTFELTETFFDEPSGARGHCRYAGTITGFQARVMEGECRYVSATREGRLFDLRGNFQISGSAVSGFGDELNLTLEGKVEEVGSVRKLENGAYVERDGFQQAIVGTVKVQHLTKQEAPSMPLLNDAGITEPSCPSSLDGCWRTALNPTIVVNANEPECQAIAAQYPPTHQLDFRMQGGVLDPGYDGNVSTVRAQTSCRFVGDQGNAITPANFWSYELDYSAGATPSLRAWHLRDIDRSGFPIHCELAFITQPVACP